MRLGAEVAVSPRNIASAAASRRAHDADRPALSQGVIAMGLMVSLLHLFNFINYTTIAAYFNPPLVRSSLLVALSLLILATGTAHIKFHAQRAWDMYLICGLAFLSTAVSLNPAETLKYSAWLFLSVFVGTELSSRLRTGRDVLAALAIILLPASFLVAIANVLLGPTIVGGTGRHFGALGSHHVDTAYAMNFIAMFLALRAAPDTDLGLPGWLKLSLWGVLAWALYQCVFGLTRSVWIAVLLTFVLYFLRQRLSLRRVATIVLAAVLLGGLLSLLGTERIVPAEVRGRLEVTEQRVEAGEIDPRIDGIRFALQQGLERPLGTGYGGGLSSHNSYFNLLIYFGWPGFLLGLFAIARSTLFAYQLGTRWFMFFAIGSAGLLVHAFFEVQSLPGQANFMPLLLWYALSRAPIQVGPEAQQVLPRPRFRFVRP